jgi:2-desacetyl-2-hydroxyethyl bacteriochlorophyllide A dehydrogenase
MTLQKKAQFVSFEGREKISLKEETLRAPKKDEVMVKTKFSAISAGTEMLFYKGEIAQGMAVDATIPQLKNAFSYPLKYGYAAVGEIIGIGSLAKNYKIGDRVFAFHPHQSAFVIPEKEAILLPTDIKDEDALFLPFMETALNFFLDGNPQEGETIVVFGQGIIGLLTVAIHREKGFTEVISVDVNTYRRNKSIELGAKETISPEELWRLPKADLIYEISSNPKALNLAIDSAGFGARIIVGSWYGNKKVELDLGGNFHRGRISLVSSQVSTINPRQKNYTKEMRVNDALDLLKRIKPSSLISHRFNVAEAAEAYKLIASQKRNILQVIIDYE